MVAVPAGTFMMGSTSPDVTDRDEPDERPQRELERLKGICLVA